MATVKEELQEGPSTERPLAAPCVKEECPAEGPSLVPVHTQAALGGRAVKEECQEGPLLIPINTGQPAGVAPDSHDDFAGALDGQISYAQAMGVE